MQLQIFNCFQLLFLFIILQSLNDKHLRPDKEGSYTSGDKSVKLDLVHMKDLVPAINLKKVVFGKVVC